MYVSMQIHEQIHEQIGIDASPQNSCHRTKFTKCKPRNVIAAPSRYHV